MEPCQKWFDEAKEAISSVMLKPYDIHLWAFAV